MGTITHLVNHFVNHLTAAAARCLARRGTQPQVLAPRGEPGRGGRLEQRRRGLSTPRRQPAALCRLGLRRSTAGAHALKHRLGPHNPALTRAAASHHTRG